ncbi:LacI family DNA-binding transcriptional regulator [Actinomadura keratinilytica]
MARSAEVSRPPTMADVAREAGVSHQTVSRVLSGHPHVRPATRAQVTAAVDRLGYRRNPAARALVTRRTRTLGVIAVNTTLYGPASTMAGLHEAARDEGYLVSAVTLRGDGRQGLKDAVDHLSSWGVEGVVALTPQRTTGQALARLDAPFPVVSVEGGDQLGLPAVSLDQERGARMVTEHLLAAGHATVWHVAGPDGWSESEARTAGWRAVLRERGIDAPPPLQGDWSPLSGYRARPGTRRPRPVRPGPRRHRRLRRQRPDGPRRPPRPARSRVRTPERVAVAGFDDIPEAEFFPPPLTTVRQDFGSIGRKSIRLLVDHIEGRADGNEHLLVEPQLIVRGSTRGWRRCDLGSRANLTRTRPHRTSFRPGTPQPRRRTGPRRRPQGPGGAAREVLDNDAPRTAQTHHATLRRSCRPAVGPGQQTTRSSPRPGERQRRAGHPRAPRARRTA